MEKLFEFHWDCGRMGSVDGLFISTDEEVERLVGEDVYFGEVLGKHSEIEGKIEEGEIQEVSTDEDLIAKLKKTFQGNTISGYNPFDYVHDDCDE